MRITVPGGFLEIDESYLDATPETIRQQVREYTDGNRREFDLGVRYPADFTGRVMRAMTAIPYGETRTYGDLADTLDSSAIAVGGACGRNPVPLVVPCHRVVGADGLRGYSGEGGIEQKRALLEHEQTTADTASDQRKLSRFE